jgi:transcriptional regulator with XRE-family HTH domain
MATWGAEVEARAAAKGLRLTEVAARMGVLPQQLSEAFTHPEITEAFFLRITAALGMVPEDWDRPLPRKRTVLQSLRLFQERTRKNDRSGNGSGGSGAPC